MIYLDTSALVKEYHDEEGSDYVHELFKKARGGEHKLVISLWAVSETLNALDRHKRRGELGDADFEFVIGAIFSDLLELEELGALDVIELETRLVKLSWELIISDHLSAGDALHLVTALDRNAAKFLAADRRLVTVAKRKGLEALNVEEAMMP
jgi:predicted nucleic acid-binding protein